MIRAATAAAIALALLAGGAGAARGPPASPSAIQPSAMHTAGTLPPRAVLAAMPDFNGIGPLRFGMTAREMRRAWGLPLYGRAPADDPQGCWYLAPREDNRDVTFMLEAGRFVRIDVRSADKTAPGGGRIGMSVRDIDRLYAGRITATPGKYDPSTRTLSVSSPRHVHARLIFETGPRETVTAWRIGVVPQVDYVEGCQ